MEILIWGVPAVIVGVLGSNLWHVSHKLDPYDHLSGDKPALEIQVISLDGKWLFIYPEQRVASVNEVVFPVDRPVRFRLTSGTVMQSFMIPRLGGQIYTMAGMITKLNLLADRVGTYRGLNTQYNREGFPDQKFTARCGYRCFQALGRAAARIGARPRHGGIRAAGPSLRPG